LQCLGESNQTACPECADMDTCGIKLVMTDVEKALSGVLDATTIADMLQRSEFERQKKEQVVDFAI